MKLISELSTSLLMYVIDLIEKFWGSFLKNEVVMIQTFMEIFSVYAKYVKIVAKLGRFSVHCVYSQPFTVGTCIKNKVKKRKEKLRL